MFVRLDKKTKNILTVSPEPLKEMPGTVVVEVPWLNHTNIEHLYVDKNGNIKEYDYDQKAKIDARRLEEKKEELLSRLYNVVSAYIFKHYPAVKQDSDNFDKDYYGSWLIKFVVDEKGNPVYNADLIRLKVTEYAMQIWKGISTLDKVLETIKKTELKKVRPSLLFKDSKNEWESIFITAWEQLIKAGVRTIFVQECKRIAKELKNKIMFSNSIDELPYIPLDENDPLIYKMFPKLPL